MLVSCMFMSFGIVVAQEDASDASNVPKLPVGAEDASDTEILSDGAKISGHVFDSSAEKNPIEGVTVTIVRSVDEKTYTVTTDNKGAYEKTNLKAGRYFMNYAKDGYGERFGKSKVVAAGGEIYDRIIMRKKENIISFLRSTVLSCGHLLSLLL